MNEPKRIELPSGRTIEVVVLVLEEPARRLHVCPSCASELVHPVDWDEAGKDLWTIRLRCPACEWSEMGIYGQDVVDDYDEELSRGTESLVRSLDQLARANRQEEIDVFAAALGAGAILPEDFALDANR